MIVLLIVSVWRARTGLTEDKKNTLTDVVINLDTSLVTERVRYGTASGGASVFYLLQSATEINLVWFGLLTDLIAPGDYDGDCKTDFCVVRRENINLRWWIRRSSDGNIINHLFGLSNEDFVTQDDYNEDGITDLSVWRPNADPTQNFFYVRSSAGGQVFRSEWGIGTDYPAANFNVH